MKLTQSIIIGLITGCVTGLLISTIFIVFETHNIAKQNRSLIRELAALQYKELSYKEIKK